MNNDLPRILLISSENPLFGPGRLLLDYRAAFIEEGINADYLTLNPVDGYDDIRYVNQTRDKRKIRTRVRNYVKHHLILNKRTFEPQGKFYFFYKWEEFPPVSNRDILSCVGDRYDMIIILFWQKMLSFSSIKALYKKFRCQIHFLAVDYSPMSGGCHFTCDCEKYQTGCHSCQSVKPLWANRFAAHNIRYRKKVYDLVKPIVWGNTYMHSYYEKSILLRDSRYEKSQMIINLNQFSPQNSESIRREYNIDLGYSFIISFGCQSLGDDRKGMNYLLTALSIIADKLSIEERNRILVLSIGQNALGIEKLIPFDYLNLGRIPFDKLPKFYSVSDVFLCTSVYDAGPMMVNQALSCGTPVVAFEMGTALDCVNNQGTGYCVPMKDVQSFADAVLKIVYQTSEEHDSMRKAARKYAEENYSYEANVKDLLRAYFKYN